MKPHNDKTSIIILTAFGLLAGAGCTLSAEADVKDVEITWHGLGFDGAPEGTPTGMIALTRSFELDSSNVAWAKQLNANVRVTKVRVRATEGVENLDFVQFASVGMADAANAQAPVPIMYFERPATAASSPEVEVESSPAVDATMAWSSERVRIDVTLAGVLPGQAWAIDVSLWLDGEIALVP
jgi:hypothetical protein